VRSVHDTNHKGNVAEAVIAAEAIKLGIPVLKPLVEHSRYDLAFDLGAGLARVQCKWAPRRGDVVAVKLMSSRYKPSGENVRLSYTADEIDAVAVYCEEIDECYLLPIERFAGRRGVHLRLASPRNGQRASLNWADEYRLGAVAQLARATRWQRVGRGFESHQLHSSRPGQRTIGIDEFRVRFGWYMERARDGERFLITRRGRPHAALGPPQECLPGIEMGTSTTVP
jgi:prevent-host-death family protein